VSLAPTMQHALLEKLLRQQLLAEEQITKLGNHSNQHRKWMQTEDFVAEEEINAAVEKYYQEKGCEVFEFPQLKVMHSSL